MRFHAMLGIWGNLTLLIMSCRFEVVYGTNKEDLSAEISITLENLGDKNVDLASKEK